MHNCCLFLLSKRIQYPCDLLWMFYYFFQRDGIHNLFSIRATIMITCFSKIFSSSYVRIKFRIDKIALNIHHWSSLICFKCPNRISSIRKQEHLEKPKKNWIWNANHLSFDKLKFNIVHDKPEVVNVSRPLGVMDIEDNKYIFKSHEKMELIFCTDDPNLCACLFF